MNHEEFLTEHGYEVVGIGRAVSEAVVLGRKHKPYLAVLDLKLADASLGTDIVTHLSEPMLATGTTMLPYPHALQTLRHGAQA